MRIGILTSSVSHRGGGVFGATRGLAEHLASQPGVSVSVIGLADDRTNRDLALWGGTALRTVTPCLAGSFAYAPTLGSALMAVTSDVLHQQGIWMYPSVAGERWQRRSHRPRLVSPHGMLNPAALALSRIKKTLALLAYESRSLHRASCFHALGDFEAGALRRFGIRQPIAVIPSGVELPPTDWMHAAAVPVGARRTVLFIGRLCPNKGVLELISAWGLLIRQSEPLIRDWSLAIVGWGDCVYINRLREAIDTFHISHAVTLLGERFGRAKEELLFEAAAVVLPSAFESLPMTILEAWAHGLPALVTDACNCDGGVACGAAMRIDREPSLLARRLLDFFALSDRDRSAMGVRGREHVERAHHWPDIARQHLAAYSWLIDGGRPPECLWDG